MRAALCHPVGGLRSHAPKRLGCAAQLVSTGAIECAEAGSHQRPNRHAELGRDMFRCLERLLADPAASRAQRLLSRRIHTKRAPCACTAGTQTCCGAAECTAARSF